MTDRRLAWILGLMIWTLGAIPVSSSPEGMLATGLRCEYRIDPLGIDTPQPRLSWALRSGERGQKQTAYRVLVADSYEKLDQDLGNLWDSGRVKSAESLHRVYRGIPLTSRQRCFWKVRVWDRARQPSVWSKPAYWESGLLFPEDWKGIWISDGKPLPEKDEAFYAEDPAPASKLVTPIYVESARLFSRLAGLLGREQDRRRYDRLAGEIQKAYLADFLEPGTGRIQPVSQAGQVFALALDILPQQEREAALHVLLQKLKQQDDGHLTTGIYGTSYLLDVLARTGHMETAAQIVRKKSFPGWGYMLETGASTLWEHWALSDNTFSHNHPMFGSISEWFFKWMAGIQPHPQAFGFDRIVIRPQLVSHVDWAEAHYRSVRGDIAVRWDRAPGMCQLSVDIPANTSAEIFVPCPDQASVREGDKPAESVPGIRYLGLKNGCSVYQVGSGSYLFSFPDSSGEMHDTH